MKKKLVTLFALVGIVSMASAKMVKFSVDMTGLVKNATGIHIAGDFQSFAGYGLDWQSNTTLMTQEVNDTNIYTVVVNIPAFKKYEFKYFNGDQFYEAEYVPIPSRVLYQYIDNRWLYVDSLANDTSFVGAIPFGGTAPVGKRLLRFRVDMQNETLNAAGAHVAGDFQTWSTVNTMLYSFDTMVYEYIAYVDTNTINYTFKYLNGITNGDYETIIGACADVSGNRTIAVVMDTMLDVVCFNYCAACISTVSIDEHKADASAVLWPNPTDDYSTLEFGDAEAMHLVTITDIAGREVRTYPEYVGASLRIEKGELEKGIYFVNIFSNKKSTIKLVVQ